MGAWRYGVGAAINCGGVVALRGLKMADGKEKNGVVVMMMFKGDV